ncbi:MAG: ArsA family ATPase [Longimicrobiales bacterium]
MNERLLEQLDRRWTLVAGKGGVGKTTAAGALALALADREATHLISVDPAHSLGDLFEQAVAPGPVTADCAPRLRLEEFDADRFATAWRERHAPALTQLIERGTYLDADDVGRFTTLSLPGADEIMAALRVAELDATDTPRVVVDTAPTGHTLRLLDAAKSLAGWIEALRAMEDKAEAVAGALLRGRVQLTGGRVLDELEEALERYERVLGGAACVIVARSEPLVAIETERLRDALGERGLTVAAELVLGPVEQADAPPGQVARFTAWAEAPPVGCDLLRAWPVREARSTQVEPPVHGPRRRDVATHDAALILERFAGQRMLFFVGKGGVGKTTCAAATAVALAERLPVELYGIDPAALLPSLLVPGEPLPDLGVEQLDATTEFAMLGQRIRAQLASLADAIGLPEQATLDRRVLDAIWGLAPPGIDEIFAVARLAERAQQLAEQNATTRILVDAAPTGHFLRFLQLPDLALQWIHAVMRVLVKYGKGGDLLEVGETLLRFAQRVKRLRADLGAYGAAGAVVVTLPQRLVQRETERLITAIGGAGLALTAVLQNRCDSAEAVGGASTATRILAPETRPAPRSPDSLREFFASWTLKR